MYKPLLALILAAVPNCPLVNVAGSYTAITLHTESATVWSENFKTGCMNTGYVADPIIQLDGLIVSKRLYWGTGNSAWGGDFGGRVEPGPEPMQWVASAGDVEMKGTWKRGQLSGEFVRRFIYDGKEIECRGKVSGFKRGK